jgi:2-dehydropantoate 2-reductase
VRICVVGAGALGSAIGGFLAEAGSDVHLVARSRPHVEAINSHGLRIREDSTERTVRVRASTDCSAAGLAELVIVLVKGYQTRDAVEGARAAIGMGTVILSLQNGLGNEEVIAEVVGRERVLGGRTYVGGVLRGPGQVMAACRGKHTYIGELDGSPSERTDLIAAEFSRAGLPTEVTANVTGMIWDKLLINVATGALSAITRLPYGGLYDVPEVRDCALAAIAEGIAVAAASGVGLSVTDPRAIWLKAAEGLPPDFRASMLQSLARGSRTEIDSVNGAVVRWGERCSVPTPVNRALAAAIKGIEHAILEDGAR